MDRDAVGNSELARAMNDFDRVCESAFARVGRLGLGAVRRFADALHPRDSLGRFVGKGARAAEAGRVKSRGYHGFAPRKAGSHKAMANRRARYGSPSGGRQTRGPRAIRSAGEREYRIWDPRDSYQAGRRAGWRSSERFSGQSSLWDAGGPRRGDPMARRESIRIDTILRREGRRKLAARAWARREIARYDSYTRIPHLPTPMPRYNNN